MENRDFTIFAGDDKSLVVTVTEQSDGSATDITSAAVSWKASRSLRSTAVITKATGGSGIVLTTPSSGIFTITLTPTNTASLKGDYYHEAQITFSNGKVATVLRGVMTVELALI